MSIRENIEEVSARILNDADFAEEVEKKVLAAIKKGQCSYQNSNLVSKEWEAYMDLFANNTDELNKLIPRDQNGNVSSDGSERELARAYLIRNGVCTTDTTGRMLEGIWNRLD